MIAWCHQHQWNRKWRRSLLKCSLTKWTRLHNLHLYHLKVFTQWGQYVNITILQYYNEQLWKNSSEPEREMRRERGRERQRIQERRNEEMKYDLLLFLSELDLSTETLWHYELQSSCLDKFFILLIRCFSCSSYCCSYCSMWDSKTREGSSEELRTKLYHKGRLWSDHGSLRCLVQWLSHLSTSVTSSYVNHYWLLINIDIW